MGRFEIFSRRRRHFRSCLAISARRSCFGVSFFLAASDSISRSLKTLLGIVQQLARYLQSTVKMLRGKTYGETVRQRGMSRRCRLLSENINNFRERVGKSANDSITFVAAATAVLETLKVCNLCNGMSERVVIRNLSCLSFSVLSSKLHFNLSFLELCV